MASGMKTASNAGKMKLSGAFIRTAGHEYRETVPLNRLGTLHCSERHSLTGSADRPRRPMLLLRHLVFNLYVAAVHLLQEHLCRHVSLLQHGPTLLDRAGAHHLQDH